MMKRISRRAFTMVELLVVIGIVTLAAAIFIPAAQSVRNQAQSVGCIGVLQSIGNALAVYKSENDGSYPWGLRVNAIALSFSGYAFKDVGTEPIDYNSATWWSVLRAQIIGGDTPLHNGIELKHNRAIVRSMDTFNCPSAQRRDAGCDFVANSVVMINQPTEVFNNATRHPFNYRTARPGTDANVPADVAVVWDAPEILPEYDRQSVISDGLDNSAFLDPRKPSRRYRNFWPGSSNLGDFQAINPGPNTDLPSNSQLLGGIRWRHVNNTANFLFADGSARGLPINVFSGNTWTGEVKRRMFRPRLPSGYLGLDL